MSKRGDLISWFLYTFSNINPVRNESAIKPCQGLDVLFWHTPNREFKYHIAKTKNGTTYEVYEPKKGAHKENCIYYLHGGAYIGKNMWVYRYQSRYFSNAADGATVVYVDYDVAPGAKYPTQLNQALDVLDEINNVLGFKTENCVFGGDSAGGNLTLALLLKLRDEGKPLPRGIFTFSAWADMLASGKSYEYNYQKDPLFGDKKGEFTPDMREKFMDYDVFSWCLGSDRADPYVSPVYGDYKDCPPAFMAVGEGEMLRSDTDTIAENMRSHGIDVEVDYGKNMWHAYPIYHGIAPEASDTFAKCIAFINKCFDYYGYTYPHKEYILS